MMGTAHMERCERKIISGASHRATAYILRTSRLASRRDPPGMKAAEHHPTHAFVRQRTAAYFAVTPNKVSNANGCSGGVGQAAQPTQTVASKPAKDGVHRSTGLDLRS